jgi:hypothetical protein
LRQIVGDAQQADPDRQSHDPSLNAFTSVIGPIAIIPGWSVPFACSIHAPISPHSSQRTTAKARKDFIGHLHSRRRLPFGQRFHQAIAASGLNPEWSESEGKSMRNGQSTGRAQFGALSGLCPTKGPLLQLD